MRGGSRDGPPDVWIWADSFTDHLAPHTAHAAIRLLEAAGLSVRVIDERACCGLTWVSTGQLRRRPADRARTVATLAPYVEGGTPVLGLEPSCLAALRSDAVELTDDPRAAAVADGRSTHPRQADRPPPTGHHRTSAGSRSSSSRTATTPLCSASTPTIGCSPEPGRGLTRVAGCCGLAGNFGMERGHYETSVAVAETHLLPTVRSAPDAVVLADGMSCRLQLVDLAGVPAMHLAELLAPRLDA